MCSQIFLPPALCDMTATSVQYIGLTLTYASSFQMLRGAVIIFTGIEFKGALLIKQAPPLHGMAPSPPNVCLIILRTYPTFVFTHK